jgi:hypothetical protein
MMEGALSDQYFYFSPLGLDNSTMASSRNFYWLVSSLHIFGFKLLFQV